MQLHFTDANGTPLLVERAEFSRDSLSSRYQRDEQIPLQHGSLSDAMVAEGWLETPKKSFVFDGPGMPIRLWVKLENGQTASVTGKFPQFDNRIHFTADVTFRNLGEHPMPFTLKEGEAALLILGDDNKPVPNVTAQIMRYRKEPQICTTDANGWCLLTDLTNGQYEYITVSAPDYAPEWISDLIVGESRTVPISQRTRLKGQLTAPDGSNSGITKIELKAERKGRTHGGYYAMKGIPYIIETDAEGRYDFPVTPGVYSVRGQSESGHFLHVESFSIDDGESASLPQTLTIPAQLELILTDSASGKPAAGARIAVMQADDLFSDTAIKRPDTRTSDAEGRMRWESLPPWQVALLLLPRALPDVPASPYVRGWSEKGIYDNGRSATFKQRPPRGDEGHDVIQFKLQPGEQTLPVTVEHGIHVSGKVLLPDELPEEGRIIVVAVPENQSLASAYTINKFSITVDRESGNFSGWLPAGNGLPHRVCAYYWSDSPHPSGYLPTALSEPFDSKSGDAFTFELSMRGGGFLSGRLTDADGNPRAGEMIACVPENRAGGTYDFSRAITDAEGRFTIGPIRASNYGITLPQYLSPGTNAHKTQQHDAIVRDAETTDIGDIHFSE